MTADAVRAAYDVVKARLDALEARLDGEQMADAVRRDLEAERTAAQAEATLLWRSYSRLANEGKHIADARRIADVIAAAVGQLSEVDQLTLSQHGAAGAVIALRDARQSLARVIAAKEANVAEAVRKVEHLLGARSSAA